MQETPFQICFLFLHRLLNAQDLSQMKKHLGMYTFAYWLFSSHPLFIGFVCGWFLLCKGVLFDVSFEFGTWKMPSVSAEACWFILGFSLLDTFFHQKLDSVPLSPTMLPGNLFIVINGI